MPTFLLLTASLLTRYIPESLSAEAARRIVSLLKVHAMQLWVDEDWRMDLTRQAQSEVSAADAAATKGSKRLKRLGTDENR
jgi:hypothetical protein